MMFYWIYTYTASSSLECKLEVADQHIVLESSVGVEQTDVHRAFTDASCDGYQRYIPQNRKYSQTLKHLTINKRKPTTKEE